MDQITLGVPMKTLNCMHKQDWMCDQCCNCSLCCKCVDIGGLVHVNSLAAQEAWRRSVGKDRISTGPTAHG